MNGEQSAIPLGDGGGPGSPEMAMGMGGGGEPSYPDLGISSDHPDMENVPEEGQATIKFHKHSHTRERHPAKPGQHKHHVRLKIHSIKFKGGGRHKVTDKQIAGALGEPGGDMGVAEEEPA